MNKDFVKYQEALELKQLGFDEPCNTCYDKLKMVASYGSSVFDYKNYNTSGYIVSRPTYSQAFRWFREKHNYHVIIDFNQSKNNKWYYGIIQINHNISISPDVEFETYEEAELAALKELIKTIKDRT
jgi:hypothetical protein